MRKMARAARPITVTTAPIPSPDEIRPPALPSGAPPASPRGKIRTLITMLREPGGATMEAMMAATGWQAHSVRGALSGSVRKRAGLTLLSQKADVGRIYRIVDPGAA